MGGNSRKVAIVTGGSQGIGLATVAALANRGMNVVSIARHRGRLDASIASHSLSLPGNILGISADVSQADDVATAVAEVMERFGRIDVLVNCAGVSMSARRALSETSPDEWNRQINTNLTGTYLMCRQVLPHLRDRESYILNVLSTAAFSSPVGMSLYAASKFGARALTEALIEEYRDSPVRISSVSPGPVNTTIWEHKDTPPSLEERQLMLEPSDIAEIFLWLLDRPARLHIPNVTVTPWTAPVYAAAPKN